MKNFKENTNYKNTRTNAILTYKRETEKSYIFTNKDGKETTLGKDDNNEHPNYAIHFLEEVVPEETTEKKSVKDKFTPNASRSREHSVQVIADVKNACAEILPDEYTCGWEEGKKRITIRYEKEGKHRENIAELWIAIRNNTSDFFALGKMEAFPRMDKYDKDGNIIPMDGWRFSRFYSVPIAETREALKKLVEAHKAYLEGLKTE